MTHRDGTGLVSVDARLNDAAGVLAEGDWEAVAGFLADRFFSYSPSPDEPNAADRFMEIIGDLRRAMPDFSATITDLQQVGDLYSGMVRVSGTHEHALWGAPGTGRSITWTNPITIKPFGDRFAVRFDEVTFPDVVAVLRQFGLVNPPERMDEPPPHPVSIPDFLLKVVLTGQADDKPCSHLSQIQVTEPSTRVCADCFREGVNWPALRMCLVCGFVGCCDTSKNKHMIRHHEETGHPIMRSIRMDEGWIWCYDDNAFFEQRTLDRYRR